MAYCSKDINYGLECFESTLVDIPKPYLQRLYEGVKVKSSKGVSLSQKCPNLQTSF
jgi:hypothetical protein